KAAEQAAREPVEEARQSAAVSGAHEPSDGTFFGMALSLPYWAGILFVLLCGCYAFWISYTAIKTGVHEFRQVTVRSKNPRLFIFQVCLTIFLGVVAFVGAIGWAFDLG